MPMFNKILLISEGCPVYCGNARESVEEVCTLESHESCRVLARLGNWAS
uniref:Uncharacterized protein n=1 Tax=Nelumbo nucifera TaxID=4432 RepID=A0A822Y4T0_NELNU|nr:TPA_asm: hypothetical protein HUJ06_028481 [Nelumbo nucifera]